MKNKKGYESQLFDIISDKKGLELFEELCIFINREITAAERERADYEYETLKKIKDIENNVGWNTEKAHSDKIDIIHKKQTFLIDTYLDP